ncbi:DUF5996 family protein [Actinomadura macrotermitis]|uniref:DUF5996 family protein n=1 Tax=Actinomadura macrotermitis TaxID=2585200 RepID=UPI001A9AEF3E|nr:DUF5996 family protein [Actinomadura macrotermitis]
MWPELSWERVGPLVEYLNPLVQIGGKYSLDMPFETGWGNVVLDVTPRGLRTPTYRQGDVAFAVHYRLLDGDMLIEADSGSATLPLADHSVADRFVAFREAAAELGIPAPRSTRICEIPGSAPKFEDDREHRPWDAGAARLVWRAFDLAAAGLEAWQAPFQGHRPRVGVMWGGFDLSATRYRPHRTTPRRDLPAFQQNGELTEYVSVGFSLGDAETDPGMYAYIWPQPDGMDGRSWGVDGATWNSAAGLVQLPWRVLREAPDPHRAIVAFGDAVYDAAVDLAGWSTDLLGPRCDGWHMSTTPAHHP